jgi:D-aspartate ligase
MVPLDHHLVPAIVLGRQQTALGALRSLRLAGIPTYVACPPGDLPTYSRWYRPTPGATAWDGTVGTQTLDILRAMPLAGAVLIPGADDAALWLADMPQSELGSRFRVSTSARQTLEILQDKVRFGKFLAQTGIAHPRTFPISSSADIDAIPFDELDRVFIKPADSQKFNLATGAKGIWAHTRKELEESWRRLDGRGFVVMAQEYVPGSSSDHYFIDGFRDRNGNLTGLFARRRIRIYPPDFGNSSYCHSIALADVQGAVDSVATLLSALSYRGIFSAEFKRDSRNGIFRILEVNTRAWWYVELAARCGVNVCEMAYQDASDLPVTVSSKSYPTGVGCANLYGDIKTVSSLGKAERGPLLKIMAQWARAHLHVFRFDDPGPGLSIIRKLLMQRIHKTVRRAPGDKNLVA